MRNSICRRAHAMAMPPILAMTCPILAQPAVIPGASGTEGFHISFNPHFWAISMNGDVGAKGVEADIDVDFLDVIDEADEVFGLNSFIDMRFDRFILFIDGSYLHTAEDNIDRAIGPINTETDITVQAVWAELGAGWRFLDEPIDAERRFRLDGIAGARFTWLDLDLDVTAEAQVTLPNGRVLEAQRSTDLGDDETWVDPFVGARLGVDLSRDWHLQFRGDVGGFGVGSDFSWQLAGVAGYRFNLFKADASFVFGYRALSQDYSSGEFKWDVITHGPIIGLQIRY